MLWLCIILRLSILELEFYTAKMDVAIGEGESTAKMAVAQGGMGNTDRGRVSGTGEGATCTLQNGFALTL